MESSTPRGRARTAQHVLLAGAGVRPLLLQVPRGKARRLAARVDVDVDATPRPWQPAPEPLAWQVTLIISRLTSVDVRVRTKMTLAVLFFWTRGALYARADPPGRRTLTQEAAVQTMHRPVAETYFPSLPKKKKMRSGIKIKRGDERY